MNERDFAEILVRGRELRAVEHKGPGLRSDKRFLGRVARAVMGMANLRDGGLVTIGVEDHDGKPVPTGLETAQLDSWRRYDDVASSLGEFTAPSVSFEHEVFSYKGATLVLLHVREFDEYPILCSRDLSDGAKDIVRRGALYVRPRRRAETAEVPTHEEMREIVDLATEKGVRRYIELARRLGLSAEGAPNDDELYDREIEETK